MIHMPMYYLFIYLMVYITPSTMCLLYCDWLLVGRSKQAHTVGQGPIVSNYQLSPLRSGRDSNSYLGGLLVVREILEQ